MSNSMIVLLQRSWQALSGLLTLYLVTMYLGPEDQGYYYTITTLVGILLALDFGLTNILVPFAAKYAPAKGGDLQAFHGIRRYAARWFFITGLLMLLFIPIGMVFFGFNESRPANHYLYMVWALVVLASMANYMVSPYVLLLEGSGKVQEVYRSRLIQGVLSSLLLWFVLVFGGGLLATTIPPFIGFIYTAIWLVLAHPTLLKHETCKPEDRQRWSKEVWPLQWRTGANVFAGYLLVFVYTPIVFLLLGPKEAGQIGLTMACMNTVFVLSISGLVSKFPSLTQLISDSKIAEAQTLYRAEARKADILYVAASTGLILFLMLFQSEQVATRFMEPSQTLCIVVAMFFYMRASAQGYLMRAHLVDHALRLNLLAVVSVVVIALMLSNWVGLWGITWAMLIVFVGMLAPAMSRLVTKFE